MAYRIRKKSFSNLLLYDCNEGLIDDGNTEMI